MEEEHAKEDPIEVVVIQELSNTTIATSLDIMPRIVGANPRIGMSDLTLKKQEMKIKKSPQFF